MHLHMEENFPLTCLQQYLGTFLNLHSEFNDKYFFNIFPLLHIAFDLLTLNFL